MGEPNNPKRALRESLRDAARERARGPLAWTVYTQDLDRESDMRIALDRAQKSGKTQHHKAGVMFKPDGTIWLEVGAFVVEV